MMPDQAETLRTRLVALRASALQQLAAADHVDAGLMRVIADANACLSVLNAEAEANTECGS